MSDDSQKQSTHLNFLALHQAHLENDKILQTPLFLFFEDKDC